jgi:hypothetical protein
MGYQESLKISARLKRCKTIENVYKVQIVCKVHKLFRFMITCNVKQNVKYIEL